MARERLRAALRSAGLSQEELAARAEVDTKTVARWIAGSMRPNAYNQRRVADALGVEDLDALWALESALADPQPSEIVNAWAHRAAVPSELWRHLLRTAEQQIDLVGYALLFLPEQDPTFIDALVDRAAVGCSVRIALGDADSEAVRQRSLEEGLGETELSARIRTSLRHLRGLQDVAGIGVATYAAPMYASIFRFDGDVLYTPHLYGRPGYRTLCFHLRHQTDGGLVTQLDQTIEAIWQDSRPAWAPA